MQISAKIAPGITKLSQSDATFRFEHNAISFIGDVNIFNMQEMIFNNLTTVPAMTANNAGRY